MPDSPLTSPENLVDIAFRTECLELCKDYFAQIKGKNMKGVTRKLAEDALKKAENTDSFSFLLLSFIKAVADLVEPNNYREYPQFSSLLWRISLSKYLREYVDTTQEPSQELIQALSDALEGISKITGRPQEIMTAEQVAKLLQENPAVTE